MKAINVNKNWALSQTYESFCKSPQISKLSKSEQKKLYTAVTGKKLNTKKKEDEGGE